MPAILTSDLLVQLGVPHAFTTRRGGVSLAPFDSLNFGNPGDLPPERKDPRENILENWRRTLVAIQCDRRRVIEVHQVHGGDVHTFSNVLHKRIGDPVLCGPDPKADAIVTDDPTCVAAVRVADCAPILISDHLGQMVAAVHAGWRGVIAGVAANAVRTMRELGASSLTAAIGPCIGPQQFEVGNDVALEFRRMFGADAPILSTSSNKHLVDLQRAIEAQLRQAGVNRIDTLRRCTVSEPELFFSHRRDRGLTGRMVGMIGTRG